MALRAQRSRTFLLLLSVFLCPRLVVAQQAHLKLVWRQKFQPVPASAASIFSKPQIIDSSFVVHTFIVGKQLLVFDDSGQLTSVAALGPEGEQTYSPTDVAGAVENPQFTGTPEESDEIPSIVTGFVSGRQVWKRNSATGVRTILADSGASVDLNLYSLTLSFYDSAGRLEATIFPFGNELPWAFDRPAFGAFSADSSTFALLATRSDSQSAGLFVYDSTGTLRTSHQLSQFKIAAGLGVLPDASEILVAGWNVDPITQTPTVSASLTDLHGNPIQQFQVPSIGEQVIIVPDLSTGEFVLNNQNGTTIRVGQNLPPSIFNAGTGLSPTSVASAAGITAVVTLESHDSQTNETMLVLRLVDRNSTLLRQETLGGNTLGLDTTAVWLSKDANFVAVRFADEIRYYQVRLDR